MFDFLFKSPWCVFCYPNNLNLSKKQFVCNYCAYNLTVPISSSSSITPIYTNVLDPIYIYEYYPQNYDYRRTINKIKNYYVSIEKDQFNWKPCLKKNN